MSHLLVLFSLFFFNDTPTTEIYTLSLHDALPIFNFDNRVVLRAGIAWEGAPARDRLVPILPLRRKPSAFHRSEEHTSELQSHVNLVCRLLLEKKKKHTIKNTLPCGYHCTHINTHH